MTDLQPELPERDYRPIHPEPAWRALARKLWAPIAVAIGLVVKFGFAFAKFASVFVAVGGYAGSTPPCLSSSRSSARTSRSGTPG